MTNIPTDLLRALVAVVDHRSFTRAAASLGVTQPAVSAQIKRLQMLLGGDLFDRSTQGVALSPHGEKVVSYARRLLSINDEIVRMVGAPRAEVAVRVGTSSDYVASKLPDILARFRVSWPGVRFLVRTASYDVLARDLRSGELDVFVGLSASPEADARHTAATPVVWACKSGLKLDPERPVPLVTCGDTCMYHRIAVAALKSVGRDWEAVFTGPSMTSLDGAVTAGLGVTAITRRRAEEVGLTIIEDDVLPRLPDLYSSIFICEGGARAAYEQLADDIAAAIYMPEDAEPVAAETTAA